MYAYTCIYTDTYVYMNTYIIHVFTCIHTHPFIHEHTDVNILMCIVSSKRIVATESEAICWLSANASIFHLSFSLFPSLSFSINIYTRTHTHTYIHQHMNTQIYLLICVVQKQTYCRRQRARLYAGLVPECPSFHPPPPLLRLQQPLHHLSFYFFSSSCLHLFFLEGGGGCRQGVVRGSDLELPHFGRLHLDDMVHKNISRNKYVDNKCYAHALVCVCAREMFVCVCASSKMRMCMCMHL